MTAWIKKKECSEAHRRSLGQSLRHLLQSSHSKSSVGEMPSMLNSLREKMQGKHPRSWNLARAAAQAYLAETVGRNHALYHAVQDLRPLKVTAQRLKHSVTPDELSKITKKMKVEYANIVWGMATTGMGPGEFWGKWEINGNRVYIHGTKRKARERVVPAVWPFYAPSVQYAAFRRALRDAGALQPYDLRRSYAAWLEEAQVPRNRRISYMGHAGSVYAGRFVSTHNPKESP